MVEATHPHDGAEVSWGHQQDGSGLHLVIPLPSPGTTLSYWVMPDLVAALPLVIRLGFPPQNGLMVLENPEGAILEFSLATVSQCPA